MSSSTTTEDSNNTLRASSECKKRKSRTASLKESFSSKLKPKDKRCSSGASDAVGDNLVSELHTDCKGTNDEVQKDTEQEETTTEDENLIKPKRVFKQGIHVMAGDISSIRLKKINDSLVNPTTAAPVTKIDDSNNVDRTDGLFGVQLKKTSFRENVLGETTNTDEHEKSEIDHGEHDFRTVLKSRRLSTTGVESKLYKKYGTESKPKDNDTKKRSPSPNLPISKSLKSVLQKSTDEGNWVVDDFKTTQEDSSSTQICSTSSVIKPLQLIDLANGTLCPVNHATAGKIRYSDPPNELECVEILNVPRPINSTEVSLEDVSPNSELFNSKFITCANSMPTLKSDEFVSNAEILPMIIKTNSNINHESICPSGKSISEVSEDKYTEIPVVTSQLSSIILKTSTMVEEKKSSDSYKNMEIKQENSKISFVNVNLEDSIDKPAELTDNEEILLPIILIQDEFNVNELFFDDEASDNSSQLQSRSASEEMVLKANYSIGEDSDQLCESRQDILISTCADETFKEKTFLTEDECSGHENRASEMPDMQSMDDNTEPKYLKMIQTDAPQSANKNEIGYNNAEIENKILEHQKTDKVLDTNSYIDTFEHLSVIDSERSSNSESNWMLGIERSCSVESGEPLPKTSFMGGRLSWESDKLSDHKFALRNNEGIEYNDNSIASTQSCDKDIKIETDSISTACTKNPKYFSSVETLIEYSSSKKLPLRKRPESLPNASARESLILPEFVVLEEDAPDTTETSTRTQEIPNPVVKYAPDTTETSTRTQDISNPVVKDAPNTTETTTRTPDISNPDV